jgi:hypothetical protein
VSTAGSPIDAEAAFAFVDDTRRIAVSMASRLADEFARLVPSGGEREPAGTGARDPDLARALRNAQADAERAMDSAMSALGDALGSYGEIAQRIASTAPATGGTEIVEMIVNDGGTATRELWLHNTTNAPTPPLAIDVGELLDDAGTTLPAEVRVGWDDTRVLAPGESIPVSIEIEPEPCVTATDRSAGRYHGLVRTRGVPDAVVHLVVDLRFGEQGP